jgi:hypothetical protein
VESGERELALGLDALRPQQPDVRCAAGDLVEQRGLADSRDAAHEQHAAPPRPRCFDHAPDRVELGPAADQGG